MSKQVKYNQLLITQDDCQVAARIVYINRTGTELSQEWASTVPMPSSFQQGSHKLAVP